MTNVTLNTATRKCTADKYFLGYEGENKINKLIFKFEDGFRDGLGILNVKRGEEKGYLDLKKVGDTYELEVKSALLSKSGEITFQFTVNEPDGTVIKYDAFPMVAKVSIDTDVEMPEDYPNWVDMANAKLTEVDTAIKNAEHATENAAKVAEELVEARENGEFNGEDGFSPSAKVIQTDDGAVLTVTDKKGTTSAIIKHGQGGGEGGGTGADGFSPIANVAETEYGAEIVITDKKGTTTAKIYNGKDGTDGNDGSDGLTPYIGANGNWWIGEEDTGKPSVGTGSGGLAELPVATSDILGGIKVGEGLSITEDGVLSALGGGTGTGVGTVTEIFSGEANVLNTKYTISQSIEDFDMVLVVGSHEGIDTVSNLIPTALIKENYNASYDVSCMVAGSDITRIGAIAKFRFKFEDDTNFVLTAMQLNGWGNAAINKVYGIKLGSSGGSSYRETELLGEPAEYTVKKDAATIGQDLVLLDDVSNFYELEFAICRRASSTGELFNYGYKRLLVSNIKYNPTNTSTFDGSRFALETQAMTSIGDCCGLWFKDGKTIRIYNTISGDPNVGTSSYFRISSIKGIKY